MPALEEGADIPAAEDWWAAGTAAPSPTRLTAPVVVHAPRPYAHSTVVPAVLVVCGAVAMAASTLPWITANFLRHTSDIEGTDGAITRAISLNGWLTFSGGAAILVLGALMVTSSERALRFLVLFIAFVTAGFAAYDVFRILQQIRDARSAATRLGPFAYSLAGHLHIGYGLVVVASAAGVALVASAVGAVSSR
jgi:hypothetical protein